MQSEHNQLIQLSPTQQNPGAAKSTDFEVITADQAAELGVPGHGQHGSNKREYARLLREAQNTVGKSRLGSTIPDRNDVNGVVQ